MSLSILCWLETPVCLPLCFFPPPPLAGLEWLLSIFSIPWRLAIYLSFFSTNIYQSHKKLRWLSWAYKLPQRFLANLSSGTVGLINTKLCSGPIFLGWGTGRASMCLSRSRRGWKCSCSLSQSIWRLLKRWNYVIGKTVWVGIKWAGSRQTLGCGLWSHNGLFKPPMWRPQLEPTADFCHVKRPTYIMEADLVSSGCGCTFVILFLSFFHVSEDIISSDILKISPDIRGEERRDRWQSQSPFFYN